MQRTANPAPPVAKTEESPVYQVPTAAGQQALDRDAEDRIITQALAILANRCIGQSAMTSPQTVKDWLHVRLAPLEHEEFGALFLDAQHRVLSLEMMFRGTLTQTSVYPREVVKAALARNAAAVILAHNHPSGVPEPSRADEMLTHTLKSALGLVDVRVLDHIIVGATHCVSMAERGLV